MRYVHLRTPRHPDAAVGDEQAIENGPCAHRNKATEISVLTAYKLRMTLYSY